MPFTTKRVAIVLDGSTSAPASMGWTMDDAADVRNVTDFTSTIARGPAGRRATARGSARLGEAAGEVLGAGVLPILRGGERHQLRAQQPVEVAADADVTPEDGVARHRVFVDRMRDDAGCHGELDGRGVDDADDVAKAGRRLEHGEEWLHLALLGVELAGG